MRKIFSQVSVEYLIVLAALVMAMLWGVNHGFKRNLTALFNTSGDVIGNITDAPY
jgi:hypothetical protein